MNAAGDSLERVIVEVQAEVDAIVMRHRAELQGAVGSWLRRQYGDGSEAHGDLMEVWGSESSPDGDCFDERDRSPKSLGRASNDWAAPGAVSNIWLPPVARSSNTASMPGRGCAASPFPPEPEMLQVLPCALREDAADGGAPRKPAVGSWTSDGSPGGGAGEGPTFDPRRSSTMTSVLSGMIGNASRMASKTGRGSVRGEPKDVVFGGRFEKSKKLRCLKTVKADTLLFQDARAEALQQQTRLQRMTRHKFFEWFSGGLIAANAIAIGMAAQYMALDGVHRAKHGLPVSEREPVAFVIFQFAFTFLFTVELSCRWIAEGFVGFFQSDDVSWNSFDFAVVAFGWLDMVSSLWSLLSSSSFIQNTSILRVMRVVRIVRVVRVIRIMRFFRELRLMIVALTGSLKSVIWVFVVLIMLFFIFGISLTNAVTDLLNAEKGWAKEEHKDLLDNFGTLEASILTLYMSMSGGQDWGDIYAMLSVLPITNRFLFLLFVSFALFAVVNIVTGIFVDTALQCNSSDNEAVVQEELAAKERYLERMRRVFDEMNTDGTGRISMEDFERKLDDERVKAYFNALKLDVSDASKLFLLLDYDQSGEISIEEFLQGVQKLKGESRALDMAIMMYEVRWLAEALINLQDFCDKGFARIAPRAS